MCVICHATGSAEPQGAPGLGASAAAGQEGLAHYGNPDGAGLGAGVICDRLMVVFSTDRVGACVFVSHAMSATCQHVLMPSCCCRGWRSSRPVCLLPLWACWTWVQLLLVVRLHVHTFPHTFPHGWLHGAWLLALAHVHACAQHGSMAAWSTHGHTATLVRLRMCMCACACVRRRGAVGS